MRPLHWLLALLALLAVIAVAAGCTDDDDGGAPQAARSPSPAPAAGTTVEGWPSLARDHRSSFHNPDETVITVDSARRLREAWSIEVRGFVGGVPAVSADGATVYALATGGLYALDARDGRVVWQNQSVRGTSSPTLHEGSIFVNDSGSEVVRVDATTGEERWRSPIDEHPRAAGFSSPVIAGGLAIVGSASTEEVSARGNATFRGSLVAFDVESGREVWRHYTAEPPYNGVAIWSSSSVDDEAGVVFATTGNNYTEDAGPTSDSIFALDLASGDLLWSAQLSTGDVFTIPVPRSDDSDFGTNPILFEATIDGRERKLLGAGQKSGTFWVLDRETGEVVWNRKASGGSALIGGVFNNGAYDGERIVIAGNNGTSDAPGGEPSNGASRPIGSAQTTTSVLMALDPATGDVLWERQLPAWVWAPITMANGVGFVSADSEFQAFDVATGEKLFAMKTAGTIASGASVAGGRVFFGSGLAYFGTTNNNRLHALEVTP